MEYVQAGVTHLQAAKQLQKNTRKWACCALIVSCQGGRPVGAEEGCTVGCAGEGMRCRLQGVMPGPCGAMKLSMCMVLSWYCPYTACRYCSSSWSSWWWWSSWPRSKVGVFSLLLHPWSKAGQPLCGGHANRPYHMCLVPSYLRSRKQWRPFAALPLSGGMRARTWRGRRRRAGKSSRAVLGAGLAPSDYWAAAQPASFPISTC